MGDSDLPSAVGPRTVSYLTHQRRHWALTGSRPCANLRRFIHRLAHLFRKRAQSPITDSRATGTALLATAASCHFANATAKPLRAVLPAHHSLARTSMVLLIPCTVRPFQPKQARARKLAATSSPAARVNDARNDFRLGTVGCCPRLGTALWQKSYEIIPDTVACSPVCVPALRGYSAPPQDASRAWERGGIRVTLPKPQLLDLAWLKRFESKMSSWQA